MAVATPATRPRANSSRIFIIAGAALAALAFILVIFLGGNRAGGGLGGPQVKIVVAARDIPFRTALSRDDLTLASYPQSLVPAGSYTKLEDVIGKQAANAPAGSVASNDTGAVAEVQIKQGQPVTQNLLARSVDAIQVQPAYLPIPKGFVTLTVPTGEQVGVAGYIQAGDYINIIASVNTQAFSTGPTNGPSKSVTKTVFTNVHVLKVGPATGTVSQGSAPTSANTGGIATSLTLVMTQCDAEMLKWLQGSSQLTYTLGSYQDYKPNDAKADPSCADATAAKGVGPQAVNARWGFTSTN